VKPGGPGRRVVGRARAPGEGDPTGYHCEQDCDGSGYDGWCECSGVLDCVGMALSACTGGLSCEGTSCACENW
jgi:hypothetical protein